MAHFSAYGSHSTKTALINQLQEQYYHPLLAKKAAQVCDACVVCAYTLPPRLRRSQYGLTAEGRPRELWYIDLCQVETNPNRYFFVAVESCFTYTYVQYLRDRSKESLWQAILQLRGLYNVRAIQADNESSLHAITEDLKKIGLEVRFIAAGSSFGNGRAEIRVGALKALMRSMRVQDPEITGPELASACNLILNKRTAHGQRYTPEQLMFGNSHALPNAIIAVGSDDASLLNPDEEEAIESYVEKKRERAKKNRDRLNANKKLPTFKVGQIVWASNRNLVQADKSLRTTQQGPFVIEAIETGKRNAALRHILTGTLCKRRLDLLTSALQDFRNQFLNRSWANQIKRTPGVDPAALDDDSHQAD